MIHSPTLPNTSGFIFILFCIRQQKNSSDSSGKNRKKKQKTAHKSTTLTYFLAHVTYDIVVHTHLSRMRRNDSNHYYKVHMLICGAREFIAHSRKINAEQCEYDARTYCVQCPRNERDGVDEWTSILVWNGECDRDLNKIIKFIIIFIRVAETMTDKARTKKKCVPNERKKSLREKYNEKWKTEQMKSVRRCFMLMIANSVGMTWLACFHPWYVLWGETLAHIVRNCTTKANAFDKTSWKKYSNFFLVVVIIVAVLAGLFLSSYCFLLSVNDETQKWEKGLLKKNDAIHEDREKARYGNGRHFAPINFGCTQIGAASGNNESLSAI